MSRTAAQILRAHGPSGDARVTRRLARRARRSRTEPFAVPPRRRTSWPRAAGAPPTTSPSCSGPGWSRAAAELGDRRRRRPRRPPRLPAAVGGRPRRVGALGRARRARRARVPRSRPPLRGPRPGRRRPRRAHGRRGRLPDRRAHQRRRLAAPGVADRPAGPDRRPDQPHRSLAADRTTATATVRVAIRRPQRPLHAAPARPRQGGRPDAPGGRVRRLPRARVRDAGRDPHGRHASAATSSACRPCSRRSPPATSGSTSLGLSLATNLAAGISDVPIDGAHVLAAGDAAGERIGRLLRDILTADGIA